MGNIEVSAVCDLNTERAAQVARAFGIEHSYGDTTEMLQREQPESVFILTSPKSHTPLAVQAMQSGAHVFLEKPMATSTRECDEIIAAARDTGRIAGLNHNRLFLRTVKKARAMLQNGSLGTLNGVEIRFIQRAREVVDNEKHWAHHLAGGAFGENAPHALYLMRAFIGEAIPVGVHFDKRGSRPWMEADELRVIFKGSQAPGSIIHSFNAPCDFEMIDIYGSRANLHLVLDSLFVIYGKGEKTSKTAYALGYLSEAAQMVASVAGTAAFHAVARNTTPPVTAEDGRAQAQMLEDIVSLAQKS
jgi:predicted dehydrogenase